MASITDSFKDVFLAGVGAMAIGAEKSKELLDQMVERGEITMDQSRDITDGFVSQASKVVSEITGRAASVGDDVAAHAESNTAKLKSHAADVTTILKHDILEAQMAMMSQEDREQFAAKAAEIANRDAAAAEVEVVEEAEVVQPSEDDPTNPYELGVEGD